MENILPPIPAKRYFTIGEVADLCAIKPHVLRYWEQEFTQLKPMKRSGNRRYYQRHEVQMIRRIRDLLYEQGFTINGARNKLQEMMHSLRTQNQNDSNSLREVGVQVKGFNQNIHSELNDEFHTHIDDEDDNLNDALSILQHEVPAYDQTTELSLLWRTVRQELFEIRTMLNAPH
ncbi:MAG TPA: MerR family transcriptional regulator [Burkholderiaceae bacterium]|mgnify:CR=1 FL=1|nr:MerR family transcriptional regulator [Burkholderiaceae bacterium]